mmetsp:Transcript_86399/g.267488  ORF Transcript_86399/g.267488 Transcript_86399/m.267488 type:complete len:204 (+) Transcript_86399:64-675(+)
MELHMREHQHSNREGQPASQPASRQARTQAQAPGSGPGAGAGARSVHAEHRRLNSGQACRACLAPCRACPAAAFREAACPAACRGAASWRAYPAAWLGSQAAGRGAPHRAPAAAPPWAASGWLQGHPRRAQGRRGLLVRSSGALPACRGQQPGHGPARAESPASLGPRAGAPLPSASQWSRRGARRNRESSSPPSHRPFGPWT